MGNGEVGRVLARTGMVAYEANGHGPPLLLLHANGLDRASFDAVVPALSRTHRTFAIDWPGMGESAPLRAPREGTAALLADVLEDVVAGLGLRSVVLVGNSVGGFAAARLAARHPSLVRALVLVDSGGFAESSLVARGFCAMKGREWVTRRFEARFAAYYLARRNPHVMEILRRVEAAHRDDARVAMNAALWRSFAQPESDVRAEARRISCPTLLVWGQRDPVIRAEVEGRVAESLIRGARLVRLDTGHCPFAEDTDAFLDAVVPFLDGLPRADAVVMSPSA